MHRLHLSLQRDGGQNDVPEHRGDQSTTGYTPYSSVMAVPISSYTDQVYRANPFHHTEKQFQAVIDVLPPKETSDYLIEQYLEKVDWSWHVSSLSRSSPVFTPFPNPQEK